MAQLPTTAQRNKTNVLIVSSVALAFISFWRAAAIVLCDLASTAYYIGGISEQAVGKAAPWFILAVMAFSYAVRSVYVESCTMFTRGGVYKVVRGALGSNMAKLSVSALMFDYILTGPISAVSAGQYIVGLLGEILQLITAKSAHPITFDAKHHKHAVDILCVLIAVATTIYFWRANLKGMHESSDKALRIMQLTTVMAVLIVGWSILSLVMHPERFKMPPLHPVFTQSSMTHGKESSLGWLEGWPKLVGGIGVMIAFGHSLLAMSGEESLAQVNREIAAPKLKNLLRAGFVIFLYSMLLTTLISFLAVMIIPDGKRVQTQIVRTGHQLILEDPKPGEKLSVDGVDYFKVDFLRKGANGSPDWGLRIIDDSGDVPHIDTNQKIEVQKGFHVERDNGGYRDNLINGLCRYLVGPRWLKLLMAAFVVIVGYLILAGAVNTSMIGSNGVLNRLSEDGVLTPWFLKPHVKFGTTYRLINIVTILQLIVIVASWGDVLILGEAYAFGVIWSFVFMTLSMVVLRFKDKNPRAYEVPLNFRIRRKSAASPAAAPAVDGTGATGGTSTVVESKGEVIIPVGIILVCLVLVAAAVINLLTKKTATVWGGIFTAGFLVAFIVLEKISKSRQASGHGHLEQFNEKSSENISREALGLTHPNPVIIAVRGPRSLPVLEKILQETDTNVRDIVVLTCKIIPARTQGVTDKETSVDEEDRDLLTKVVTVTEEVGKRVFPLVLPTTNPLYGIAVAARDLLASEIVLGVSEAVQAETQLEQFALAWGTATSEPGTSRPLKVRIIGPNVEMKFEMD